MAKRLFTTVVLTDDKGVTHTFSPQEELPDWATEFLEESWGDRTDLWGEEGDEPPPVEEMSVRDALALGVPPPDRVPLGDDRTTETVEMNQAVRTEEARLSARGAGFTDEELDAEGPDASQEEQEQRTSTRERRQAAAGVAEPGSDVRATGEDVRRAERGTTRKGEPTVVPPPDASAAKQADGK
jgi:hypothetical protein